MAELLNTIRIITKDSFTAQERQLAVAETRALLARLESPWETAFRFSYIHPACMACVQVAIDLKLFSKWKTDGGQPKTEDAIAELVNCDRDLLSRLICNLAATHMLQICGPRLFNLTPFTLSLSEPEMASMIAIFFDINGPAILSAPTFLQSTHYQMPRDPANSMFKRALGKPIWEYLSAKPEVEATVGTVMGTYAANRPALPDIYPTQTLLQDAHPEKVLLVDCGGSKGHDLAQCAAAHPTAVHQLLLQDRPPVIANATSLPTGARKMTYDFFTPQPITSAAAYYFHFILHDWNNEDCLLILSNLKPAMEKGYSKLLIHEVVLDTKHPEPVRTTTDVMMMAMASGMERTAEQWHSLLGQAGFKIEAIHDRAFAAESVIEAVPV